MRNPLRARNCSTETVKLALPLLGCPSLVYMRLVPVGADTVATVSADLDELGFSALASEASGYVSVFNPAHPETSRCRLEEAARPA